MPVKLDWKNLHKNLIPIALAYGANKAQQPELEALVEVFETLGFKIKNGKIREWLEKREWLPLELESPTTENLFTQLVEQALLRGMSQLTQDSLDILNISVDSLIAAMQPAQIDLPTSSIDMRKAFVHDPTELKGYTQFRAKLAEWFQNSLGLSKVVAKTTASRLDGFFVRGLYEEWASQESLYAPLEPVFNNPFAKIDDTNRAWARYSTVLQATLDKTVLDEPFSVRQIYIPLRAYWVEKIRVQRGESRKEIGFRHVVDLDEALDEWAAQDAGSLRILSAGPGAGKSTVARIFADRQIRKGVQRVLFVPLQKFSIHQGSRQALEEFLEDKDEGLGIHMPVGPFLDSKPLIVFDGLDELAIQSESLKADIEQFIRDIEQWITKHDVKVLLTGREYLLQTQTSLHRNNDDKILHVMPFWEPEIKYKTVKNTDYEHLKLNPTNLIEEPIVIPLYGEPFIEHPLLEVDTRDSWWNAFGRLKGTHILSLPEEIKELNSLNEISSQPLLSLLLAKAYFSRLERGEAFDEDTNLNDIYEELVKRVIQRNDARKLENSPQISPEQFELFLECCAMACWHNDSGGRIADFEAIKAQLKMYKSLGILGDLERQKGSLPKLLTNFYFRNTTNAISGGVIEFTHKTFGEYLVARRLFSVLKSIEWSNEPADQQQAFETWLNATMPTAIDPYLLQFIIQEAERTDINLLEKLQQNLGNMLSQVINHNGVPVKLERLGGLDFHLVASRVANAEEALLAFHMACSVHTAEQTSLNLNDLNSFGNWLVRLRGANITGIIGSCLVNLALPEVQLGSCALSGANFENTDLEGADFTRAFLAEANFSYANLTGADLQEAILYLANLDGAILEGTNLDGANLEDANLEDSFLESANLIMANLTNAILTDAILIGADLEGANLTGASLERANFTGADLQDTDLTGASLELADLTGANLERANLKGANLNRAILTGANLKGATLQKAAVEGVNTDGVDLSEVNWID
jgi:uncharacterized protein YjbI with pentapeptide repeats